MENTRSQASPHHFKTTMESPDSSQRHFSVLTEEGIVQYTKQRPVNQFERVLRSGNPSVLLDFMKRYRAEETTCLGYVLACSNQLPEAIQFVRSSAAREEGLLLYFVRIVDGIWNIDLKQKRYTLMKIGGNLIVFNNISL
jgi:hypothetical protein